MSVACLPARLIYWRIHPFSGLIWFVYLFLASFQKLFFFFLSPFQVHFNSGFVFNHSSTYVFVPTVLASVLSSTLYLKEKNDFMWLTLSQLCMTSLWLWSGEGFWRDTSRPCGSEGTTLLSCDPPSGSSTAEMIWANDMVVNASGAVVFLFCLFVFTAAFSMERKSFIQLYLVSHFQIWISPVITWSNVQC